MADTESPETDARTTGHAWTEGECVNCRAVSPRPWAEPCVPESPRADVELTEALHRAFHEHWAPDKSLDLYPDSPLWQAQAVAVERILADRLAAVQAERDEALTRYAEREGRWGWALIREQNMQRRAESAEAERDDLRARLLAVEALADEPDAFPNPFGVAHAVLVSRLRAVLASPSTHTQRDTETAAQALREYADLAESREHQMSTRPGKESTADGRERNVWGLVRHELRARADSLAAREEQP
jgi:hypothetical protein